MKNRRIIKQFENKYELLPIGVSVYDPEGYLLYANKRAMALLNQSSQYQGFRLFDDPRIDSEAKELIRSNKQFTFEMGYPMAYELPINLIESDLYQKHYLHVIGEKVYKNDLLAYYIFYYEDRTTEKRLEMDLLRKNEQLSLALEAGDVAVWDWNVNDGRVFITDNFFGWFDKDYHFALDNIMYLKDFIHPHDRLILGAKIRDNIKNKEGSLSYEFRLTNRHNSYIWLRVMGNPIYNERDVSRFIGVIMNVDGRKREKDRLREQERYMNALLENMVAAFSVHDMLYDEKGQPVDYSFSYVNSAYEEMVGLYKEDLVGKRASEVLGPQSQQLIQTYGSVAKYGKSLHQHEFVESSNRYFDTIVYQTKRNQFAILYSDVTEKIQYEETLKHTEKMTAIGQLTGGIAHDFNNQLMIISSFSQLLQESLDDPKLHGYADKIYQATSHSQSIIKELLAFSKKGTTNKDVVDMNAMIERVGQIVEFTFAKRIQLITHIEASLPTIYGDESLLENALINLCINAKDAINETKKPVIGLSTENVMLQNEKRLYGDVLKPGYYVAIKVWDNGTGIDPAHMDKIFEPFFTTKDKLGTGMGLAAVFGTVKRHDGGVDVMTSLGEGTTITVYLPVSNKEKTRDDVATKDHNLLAEKTLLIVDDEELICHVLEEYFVSRGYEVYTAPTPKLAMTIYQERYEDIDMVIMDVIMPEMTGYDLLKVFIEVNPDVQVVFLSGYSDEDALDASLRQSVVDFVSKPVNLKDLHEIILQS